MADASTVYYKPFGYSGDGFYPASGPLPFADTIAGLSQTYVAGNTVRVTSATPITEASTQAGLGWWLYSGSEVRKITKIYSAGELAVIFGIDRPFSAGYGPVALQIIQPCFQSISLLNDGAGNASINGTPLLPGVEYKVIRENLISHQFVAPIFYDEGAGTLKISVE